MKKLLLGLLRVLLAVGAQAKLNIVVSTPDLAASRKRLVTKSKSPRSRGPRKTRISWTRMAFIVKLNRADALIERRRVEIGWLPPLLAGAPAQRFSPASTGHSTSATRRAHARSAVADDARRATSIRWKSALRR